MFPEDFSFLISDILANGGPNQGTFKSFIVDCNSGRKKLSEAIYTDNTLFVETDGNNEGEENDSKDEENDEK